ncbi:MAG: Rieske 2Fe-2S domain-containing protein [Myxococcales bacterium]|nr:Rieske 2Fe-2S domain-containing protein [Myxococcales bacterium]
MVVRVPILPTPWFEDPEIGRVKVHGGLIVARKGGRAIAYLNLCRHVPLSLDLGDGELLSADKTRLLCHHHGARYRIEDGVCDYGPCEGERLIPAAVDERDGELWVEVP